MDDRTIHVQPPTWAPVVIIAAVALGGCFYLVGKKIDHRPQEYATITVSGEGKVSVTPDIAEASFGVTTGPQKTVEAAMERVRTAMNAVVEAVKKSGVEERDIRTESFSLNPSYDWSDGKQMLRGYEATQSLHVKIRDLDKIGAIIDSSAAAGANQIGSIMFTLDDPEAARAQARTKAIEQAQEKAEALADQLDEELGELTGFSEGGAWQPPIMMMDKEMYGRGGFAADMALPVPVGEQDTTVSVTLTYALD